MDYFDTIAGDIPLSGTVQECNDKQDAGFQLETIQYGTQVNNGTIFLVNKAGFNSQPDDNYSGVSFVQIDAGADPEPIKTQKKKDGWTFIVDTQIYISSNIARVLVFGK